MATSTTSLGDDNALTGTDGADKLIAGGGSDTVNGGDGSDFINAGGGNDTIIYDENDYKILGGGGIDTLWFTGANQSLDLGWNIVSGIEKLLLGGDGGHRVTLTAADIMRVSDTDQMIIIGDSTNHIDPGTGWTFGGLTADGQSQILVNGVAKLIVALPVGIEGFSENSTIEISTPAELYEDVNVTNGVLTCEGTITVTDPNLGQGLLSGPPFFSGAHIGELSLSLEQPYSADHPAIYKYVYSVSNQTIQYLGENESLTEYFSVKSIDGKEATIDVKINGVDDRPVLVDPSTQLTVVEVRELPTTDPDSGSTSLRYLSGTFEVNDVDLNDHLTISDDTGAIGTYGNLSASISPRDANGIATVSWQFSYTDAALNILAENQESSLRGNIVVSDDSDGTVRSTLRFIFKGSNDPAVIGTPSEASVTESAYVNAGTLLTATGILSISDPDINQNSFQTIVISSEDNVGTLSIETDGSYIYSVSNADIRYLKAGESEVDNFTIKSVDGTEKDISFTINGADDGISSTPLDDDNLTGTADDDHIYGLAGDDKIFGLAGNDFLDGESGNDTLSGGDGNDLIEGGDGDDNLEGGIGNDYVDGGSGHDVIRSSVGDDTLIGGDGDDQFIVGLVPATTIITSGAGADMIKISLLYPTSKITIIDFDTGAPAAGGDMLDLSSLAIPDMANLSLVPVLSGAGHFELRFDTGGTEFTLLTLVGNNLTMAALADNLDLG